MNVTWYLLEALPGTGRIKVRARLSLMVKVLIRLQVAIPAISLMMAILALMVLLLLIAYHSLNFTKRRRHTNLLVQKYQGTVNTELVISDLTLTRKILMGDMKQWKTEGLLV